MTKKFNLSLAILMSMIFCSQLIYAQGFNSITSPDGVNVIAVGDAGLIFKSQNGGNSWASYTIPSVNFRSVASYNNSVWMSASNGKVYKTLKSNSPVNAIELGLTSSLNSIAFTSETVGYVCGDSGVVYKTINGGNNWTSASTGIPVSVSLTAISFLDESKGIAAGKDGKVYTTVNGGAQWTAEATGATRNIKDVKYFADGMVVTGEYGTLFIKEGTSNWTQVNTRIQTDVNAVSGTSIS
ncbi:MAG: YCF48-related protein, partial [Ignavibacteria bacterium]